MKNYSTPFKEIGKFLKLKRESLGIRIQDASKILGVHRQSLWRKESGEKDFLLSEFIRTAILYELTKEDILFLLKMIIDNEPERLTMYKWDVEKPKNAWVLARAREKAKREQKGDDKNGI